MADPRRSQTAGSALDFVAKPETLGLPEVPVPELPAGEARESGQNIADRMVGGRAIESRAGVLGGFAAPAPSSLGRSQTGPARSIIPPNPREPGNKPRASRAFGALKALGRVALGAAAVWGVQALGVALLPAVFGLVPVAAVWAVSSGVLLLPIALYSRYRLSLRDSPRLSKVKWMLDGSIGAYLGGLAIAVPALALTLGAAPAALAAVAAALGVGGAVSIARQARGEGSGGLLDTVLTWASLAAIPAALGAGAAGLIGIGPLLALAALPAMTTISFFLGQLVISAETGRAFSIPGSMQKIRFPAYTWVMTGVVFALTTGFGAVYSNWAFAAWMLFGSKVGPTWDRGKPLWRNLLGLVTDFNTLYLGVLAFVAATGFASPLTFLVIAFAPERAAHWTERLLGRVLRKGAPAPSTAPDPVQEDSRFDRPERWPRFHHWAKTVGLLGSIAAIGVLTAVTVFGITSLLTNLAIASALAAIPFFFATWIVKKLMKARPTNREQDPEFYGIMEELLVRINAKRAEKGKKAIPMPELVDVPMDVPNAFATGRSPSKALVGVTHGIKAMLLRPSSVRDSLRKLLAQTDPAGPAFKVFRRGIAGSIAGVPAEAGREELSQALERASEAELKALGVRMLRGVLGHEFSHVMDRHMLTGSIAGAMSSGIAFASYGVLWTVGHAKILLAKLKDRVLGRGATPPAETSVPVNDASSDKTGAQPEAVDILAAGVVLKSLPALIKVFAALWVPIMVQIVQMASSRNNEGQADEDGALLTEDPEALALALGMLMTWRPPSARLIAMPDLPRLAAMAHMMTVNPLQMLHEAGALSKQDAAAGPPVGKGDNFLFDLFLTHPDTRLRIERLNRMSEALRAKERPPRDPPAGLGGLGPLARLDLNHDAPAPRGVVAFGPSETGPPSPAAAKPGLLRRAWERLYRPIRVLPDEDLDREYWKFVWSQALINTGVSFHYNALTPLIGPTKETAHRVTDNRALNSGAQLAASLATGPMIDRSSLQRVLTWTHFFRALLMFSVPILFFHGYFAVAAFHAIIFVAGFLQTMGLTAGSVAFNRIIGPHAAYYNRANAVFTLVVSLVGVLAPLAAGLFVVAADAAFGALAGAALSYGVYGVMLLGAVLLFRKLRIPRDELLQARRDLAESLKKDRRVAGVSAERVPGPQGEEVPVLLIEVRGDVEQAQDLRRPFGEYEVRVIAKRRIVRQLIEGFRLILRDRFLKISLLFTTFSIMLADPVLFSALPRFIAEGLGVAGPRQAAVFGFFLSAAALGTGIASLLMMLRRPAKDRSMKPLERDGTWSSILHGLGWVLMAAMFFMPTMPLAMAAMAVSFLLSGPAISIWGSLTQRVIRENHPESMGKIYASMFFYQMVFSIFGAVGFGFLMDYVATATALVIAAAVMGIAAFLDFIEPWIIFPVNRDKK